MDHIIHTLITRMMYEYVTLISLSCIVIWKWLGCHIYDYAEYRQGRGVG